VEPKLKQAQTQPVTSVNVTSNQAKKVSAPAYTAQQTASAEQAYLHELRKQIINYARDTYPRRAKRRHWEGDILIQFTLTPAGNITKLKIIQGSGKKILDQAALEIFQVKMSNHFRAFPKEINRELWTIKVPVSYHLR